MPTLKIHMLRAAHFLVSSFQDSGDYDEAWGRGFFFLPRTRGIPRHLKDGRYMTLLRVVAGRKVP